MLKYLGAWLCLALGAVLITTGLTSGATGTIGSPVVNPPCGSSDVGIANPCPTATVTINETTTTTPGGAVRAAVATPPAGGWTVHITSPCPSTTNGNAPMDETLTVPDGGNNTSQALFAFPDTSDATKCVYTLVEDAVAGYTTTWDPANTFTFNVDAGIAENRSVNLTNAAAAATPTKPPASPSKTPTTTPSKTPSKTPSPSASASASGGAGTAPLASTGPRSRIDTSVILGIALCALGLVLLVAGRAQRRRAPRHA
jgi:hypothetical protein